MYVRVRSVLRVSCAFRLRFPQAFCSNSMLKHKSERMLDGMSYPVQLYQNSKNCTIEKSEEQKINSEINVRTKAVSGQQSNA